MLNKERFLRFGLDLQLEEVDPPKDMRLWAGEPLFVEENLETVLSFSLHTLLPDEEWLVIGRAETNMPDPDLTATSKGCELIFFEIKKDKATRAMADQNLGYWIRSRAEGYPYYLSRYLRLQCNREWVEPARLLGLAKGARYDMSGPVREQNLRRLKDNNDTDLPDEQFLSQARHLLRDAGWPPAILAPRPNTKCPHAGTFVKVSSFCGEIVVGRRTRARAGGKCGNGARTAVASGLTALSTL